MSIYRSGSRGKCPHCRVTVLFELPDFVQNQFINYTYLGIPGSFIYNGGDPVLLNTARCPACSRLIISFVPLECTNSRYSIIGEEEVCFPRFMSLRPVPHEVPEGIASDYREASLVLNISLKSSAALSRRCLQAVLREANFDQHDLSKQIDAALPTLPTHIRENLDAIRHIGNFAAHPQKDLNSGEILEVEVGEAEWNLEVLDDLFDFYYVSPAESLRKRNALNTKLQAIGKPPIK